MVSFNTIKGMQRRMVPYYGNQLGEKLEVLRMPSMARCKEMASATIRCGYCGQYIPRMAQYCPYCLKKFFLKGLGL